MGWDQLVDFAREAADERRATEGQPPQACPRDGEPLEQGPGGVLHCPFDGYEWPRDGRLT